MTFPPHQPDPTPRPSEDLPESLLRDLQQTDYADDVQPPSRVDEAVFAAASKHFAAQKPVIEPKTGVLGWIGQRPLRSAGLGGALLAASLLMVVLIVSPNQPAPGDRSVAMDALMDAPEPQAEDELAASGSVKNAEQSIAPRSALLELPELAAQSIGDESQSFSDSPLRDRLAYEALPPVRGDVDGDGAVTIADALLLARMTEAAGGTLDDPRFDLLGDGIVTRADADAIARLVVRLAPVPNDTPNPEGAS